MNYLPRVWLAPEEIRQLRQLVRYRATKVKEKTRIKLRTRAILREQRVANPEDLQGWMSWLRGLQPGTTDTFLRAEYLEEYEGEHVVPHSLTHLAQTHEF